MKRILWRRVGIFIAAGIVMAVCGGAYWFYLNRSFDRLEQQAMDAGEDSAEQLAYAMAEHVSATVRQIDFALRGLSQQFLDNPYAFPQAVKDATASFPALVDVQINVTDAEGMIIYSSVPNWSSVSVSDREYFRHLSQNDEEGIFVCHPVVGRFSGKWYIQFARRLEQDGRFAGVILLNVSPDYISQILRGLKLDAEDSAGLVLLSDGTYLARNHGINGLIGRQVKESRPYLLPGAPDSGVFIDEATYESVRRIYAWRKLQDLPLVTFVGLSEGDVLQPIREARFNSLMHNGILLGILIPSGFALIFLLMRVFAARRRLAESEALYRSLFEYNISIKLIVDPKDGRIVAANPAACAFYGYDHDRLVGMYIQDINCLPNSEVMYELSRARTGKKGHFQFSHRLASGEIRQVEVYSGDVRIDGRDLLYSIIHDVTEQTILARRLEESETRYRTLFKAIPEGLIVVRADGSIVEWNSAALDILQVDEEGLKARNVVVFSPTGERLGVEDYPTSRAVTCETSSGLYVVETRTGEKRWTFANSRRLSPMGENADVSAVVVFSDMTHVIALEESALISQSVFEVATEALLVTNPDFRSILINPAFYELTGYSRAEIVGQDIWKLAQPLFPMSMEQEIVESIEVRGSWSGELPVRRKNGSSFTGALRVVAVVSQDGRLLRHVGLFSDVTEKKRQEKEMWRQANFDALTGLPNRTLLHDRIRQALAQTGRKDLSVSVLFLDLDRFKPVNDTYGHAMGDQLLRHVAMRLKEGVRAGDTVARVGGDEFVILLPLVEDESLPRHIAERLLEALQRPFHIEGVVVEIAASIGIAGSIDGEHVEGLLKRADNAMYQAKKSGRRKICMAHGGEIGTLDAGASLSGEPMH